MCDVDLLNVLCLKWGGNCLNGNFWGCCIIVCMYWVCIVVDGKLLLLFVDVNFLIELGLSIIGDLFLGIKFVLFNIFLVVLFKFVVFVSFVVVGVFLLFVLDGFVFCVIGNVNVELVCMFRLVVYCKV